VTAPVPDRRTVTLVRDGVPFEDALAVEEPLEIRVDGRPVAVVMRTPGHDLDLVAGFLLTEGVVEAADDLAALAHCTDPARENAGNIVLARLAPGTRPEGDRVDRAARSFFSASSCGLCGKETIERIYQRLRPVDPALRARSRFCWPRSPTGSGPNSPVFAETGGSHGAGIFGPDGALWVAREDVGRHNAVDKCIGARLRAGHTPDAEGLGLILVVSGRAGFEVVQKAVMGRVAALVAVGAASTLAHDLAVSAGLKLFTFARGGRANVHGG
jgi:FdhD protein